VRGPLGGRCWADLHYLSGLSKLGHDVFFLEDSDEYPSCYDPSRNVFGTDPTYGLKFASATFKRFGMEKRWAYYDAHTSKWYGPCKDNIIQICRTSDLLLNLGGVNPIRPWLMQIPIRVFIDKDPVFTQIRLIKDSVRREFAFRHTNFLSLAENIGLEKCTVPNDGIDWKASRHPIFLEAWPLLPPNRKGKFTTVMRWESYPKQEFRGIIYGLKSDSFDDYFNLPKKSGSIFEIAVGSPSAPRHLLKSYGWKLQDPIKITRFPWTYQRFIQKSKAEFSVAKHGYVVSNSGWFSERSASYLASGRPVLVQETGFSNWLDSEIGVIPFNSFDSAVAGIEEINSRYEIHCRAAREIAVEYFDAKKVLESLLEQVMQ
jgi:hypothetical protein